MRYRVKSDGSLTDAKLLYDATADPRPGAPDGMKVDEEGNIYSAGPGGVWIFLTRRQTAGDHPFSGTSGQFELGWSGSKNALYRRQQQHLSRTSENTGRSRYSSRIRNKVTMCLGDLSNSTSHECSERCDQRSFPAAKSRISPRSAVRKSYCGRSSSRTQRNC